MLLARSASGAFVAPPPSRWVSWCQPLKDRLWSVKNDLPRVFIWNHMNEMQAVSNPNTYKNSPLYCVFSGQLSVFISNNRGDFNQLWKRGNRLRWWSVTLANTQTCCNHVLCLIPLTTCCSPWFLSLINCPLQQPVRIPFNTITIQFTDPVWASLNKTVQFTYWFYVSFRPFQRNRALGLAFGFPRGLGAGREQFGVAGRWSLRLWTEGDLAVGIWVWNGKNEK